MVATHMLISLCMAGLTVAAITPRQRVARQSNEGVIVTQVIDALSPEIAAAVAAALAGLQNNNNNQFSNNNQQFSNNNQQDLNAVNNANAQYSYEYQVRDDEEGTYIFKNEDRQGLDVTGVYGYVAPDGDLITVNYQAGPDGFSQELEREPNFLAGGGASNFGGRDVARPAPAPRQPALDESALIAQIIAALQPEITNSVNAAVSSQQFRG